MAYNEEITELVRKELAHVPNVEEKKMYGGIVFMVSGKMCVAVGGSEPDIVMVRVGKEAYPGALKRKGAMPTIMNGREIKGYIDLSKEGQKDLNFWVKLALAFNNELTKTPDLTSHESIEIKAPPKRVWEILVKHRYMEQWSELRVTFDGEQELRKGSKILWVGDDGEAYATGTVTDFEPEKKLRVSPQFRDWIKPVPPEDIASVFTLSKRGNGTHLEFSYGDFAKVPDGKNLWKMYLNSITPENKELVKIRELAEE